ncbi:hypothetical protein MPER_15002, partial [Moniliophthora perniciosa FA553]
EQLKLVLFEGKGTIVDYDKDPFTHGDSNAPVGSLGIVTGKSSWTDLVLPDWLEQGVEPSLRDSPDDAPPSAPVPTALGSSAQPLGKGIPSPVVLTPTTGTSPAGSGLRSAKGPWTDLDKFYEESSSDEGGEEEGEEGEGEESGGEDEDDSEEESDEEDDEGDESDGSKDGLNDHNNPNTQSHGTTEVFKQ